MKVFNDTRTAFARELGPELRQPAGLLFTMLLPFLFLVLFAPLLSGMAHPSGGGMNTDSPWQWFVPGTLVLLALSATAGAGASLLNEMPSGAFERMLVTPLNRASMIVGRALKEVVILLAQALLILALLLPTDFRLRPLGALAGLALLTVFGIGIGTLSFTLALHSRKQQTLFYGVQQMVFFPLLLLSGVLLPITEASAPSWLYVLSRINPATYVVEAERALFDGRFAEAGVLYGVLAAVAVAVLGVIAGIRGMRNASV
ncbi:ABC transporter permease [Streptomyces albireticuli]|uniref:Transport permease protein n=1 Tax=Streptomyces albireticuli TaxID=1940 RepID=A0A2A2CYS6_9ACTN|nr:ABC transporter permease [Streptomyces albireticuli]MCD9145631.1 ABC transporter permease [Streptomyces albireticuli]MCD9165637.1 ABC transporter permease [Streptomyces albireticuli]MCD9196308.1 ABC transporter permease [Streptomyces albireticuli]PAU44384.1 multidrug ABC transporter permease [Streptomyces albireticuli]